MTRALPWRSERREKQETSELWTSHCKPLAKKQAKATGWRERVPAPEAAKTHIVEVRVHGRRAVARKEAKGKRKVARETAECVRLVANRTNCSVVPKGGNEHLCAIDEDESETIEERVDNDEELQAWRVLEESENEQLQEVISRRDKQILKKAGHSSPLSVENSHNSTPKKIKEVIDRWVKSQRHHGLWCCRHVMLGGMFLRVKLERKSAPKKSVVASGERIRDLGSHSIQMREFKDA